MKQHQNERWGWINMVSKRTDGLMMNDGSSRKSYQIVNRQKNSGQSQGDIRTDVTVTAHRGQLIAPSLSG